MLASARHYLVQIRTIAIAAIVVLLLFSSSAQIRADEPYARTRDYDLQHSKIALRFNVEHKHIVGEVIHSISILRDGASTIAFDSINLNIDSVTVNKSLASFRVTPAQLLVSLPAAARAGDKFEIDIRYNGYPAKGLYFILP